MKETNKMNQMIYLCVVLSLANVLFFAEPALSESTQEKGKVEVATKQDLKDNVQQKSEETVKAENAELVQDALEAYKETLNAVNALGKKDKAKASEALEKAVDKLNIVLAHKPELSLIPIESRVEIVDIVSDLPTIEAKRTEVEFLIKQGNLQDARRMLDTMASEIRITTASLPMETYPVSIRGAARLIEEDKIAEAKAALQQILSTIILEERSIPIPIINSQLLISQSQKLIKESKTEELSQEDRDKVLGMLKQAKMELQVAEELGYGKRNREFKEIRDDIKEIENKIKQSEKTENLFEKLIERLDLFKDKISE